MLSDEQIEAFAIRAALGNNGGEWATHYVEKHKEHWRQFVRDLIAAIVKQASEAAMLYSNVIGHLCREGRTIYYVVFVDGETIESESREALCCALSRRMTERRERAKMFNDWTD